MGATAVQYKGLMNAPTLHSAKETWNATKAAFRVSGLKLT